MRVFLVFIMSTWACSLALATTDTTYYNTKTYQELQQKTSPLNGIYLGLGIGGNYITGSSDTTINDHTPTNFQEITNGVTRTYTLNKSFSGLGAAVEGVFGYGTSVAQNFYVGSDIYMRILPKTVSTSNSQTVKGVSATTELKASTAFSMGLDLRAGYLITPRVLAYISGGIDTGYTGVRTTYTSDNGTDETYWIKAWSWNFVPGIGAEFMLTNHFALKAQYSFVYVGSHSDNIKDSVYNQIGVNSYPITGTTKVNNLVNNLFMVDLIYHFNGIY